MKRKRLSPETEAVLDNLKQQDFSVNRAIAIQLNERPIVMSRSQRAMLVRQGEREERHERLTRAMVEQYIVERGDHFDYWECLQWVVRELKASDAVVERLAVVEQ